MRFSDRLLGGVLLAFAAVLAGFSMTFPAIPGQRYGAETFPLLIAVGLAVCGVTLLVQDLRRRQREPLVARGDWAQAPGALLAVAVTVGLVIAYILLSRRVGFMPMMAVVLLVLFRLLRVPWWQAVALTLVGTLLLDFVFRSLLLVPLPFGFMPYLPW